MFLFKEYLYKNKLELSGALLLLIVVFINRFPAGYIFLGGDILQMINVTDNFSSLFYELFGGASLYYGIFYLLDALGISDSAQLSWYLGIFLFASYSSFLVFGSCVFPKVSKLVRTLTALFYALNLYTLYIFTASWGFSHYQIIYIFIPALTGLYLRVLETKKVVHVFSFFLLTFFASTSFSNPAFALSTALFFLLLTGSLLLFRFIKLDTETVRLLIVLTVGSFLMNAYWMLPLLPQLRGGIQGVYSSEFVDLSERLQKTSNAIFDTIRLLPTSEQSRYFPMNFPYPDISWLKKYIAFIAFIPFFVAVVGLMRKKEPREWQLYWIFFSLFIVFIALVARVRFPFDVMNNFLFHLPGFNVLRSWDKLATFVPFLLATLLLLVLATYERKRFFKTIVALSIVVAVFLGLPFFGGGIQTKLSYILSTQKAKDFRSAKQSALVKVPDAYYDVTRIIQSDNADTKIAMLPFSPGSSTGRVNFPKWKVNGPDIANVLYGKEYVELYAYYVPGWIFARDFENTQNDPQWIVDLYGLIGVKHIFYHKDAKSESIEKMEEIRKYLEDTEAIRRVADNDFFTLYELDNKRVFPYVYGTDEQKVFVKLSPEGLSETVQNLQKKITPLSYDRHNPRKMIVKVDAFPDGSHVFLNEKYDRLWNAEFISRDGDRLKLERDESVTYANAWKIDSDLREGVVEISYYPLKLFYIGLWVSGITLLFVTAGTIMLFRKTKNL